jgi:serine protease Do
MIRNTVCRWKILLAVCVLLVGFAPVSAQDSVTAVGVEVNKKMVKLFGIGGFKGLPSYGSGILLSDEGHILTVNNHIILNTSGILVHAYDGKQFQAKVLAREPALDVAILKIDEKAHFTHFFNLEKETARPMAENGDWVLAYSNQFRIALREEPMSVQRSVIATVADLRGRRGVFDAPFTGDVYFLDAIACNPGAAGGIVTNRKGHLLGILGRELKDQRTDTWINYAVPIQAVVEVKRENKEGKFITSKETMASFAKAVIEGKHIPSTIVKREDKGAYHGIVLVLNPAGLVSTPPYVEEAPAGSPAARAGLQPDDLILYVEGESVPTIKAFRETMKQYAPGVEVTIQLQRGNKLETVKLKLTSQPKVPVSN